MADGIVHLWDAAALMRHAEGGGEVPPLLPAIKTDHACAVRCMQFNPHANMAHLLAAGYADGYISLINLENPSAPNLAS